MSNAVYTKGQVHEADGTVVVDVVRGAMGCMVWGPYDTLDPGSYAIDFHIDPRDYELTSDICCHVAVSTNLSNDILIRKEVTVQELIDGDGVCKLDFAVGARGSFEYLVYGSAFAGSRIRYARKAIRLGPDAAQGPAVTAATSGTAKQVLAEQRQPLGPLRSEAETIFRSFHKYGGEGRRGYVTNFLGGLTDVKVISQLSIWNGIVEDYPVSGNFHGSTIEWAGTLKAVLEARDVFRMIELGAGWGPWCAVGYKAAAQRKVSDIHVIGVEGDTGHTGFMKDNFAANEMDGSRFSIVPGVVGLTDGEATFPKAKDPSGVYGGAPRFGSGDGSQSPFEFFMDHCSDLVDEVERVRSFSLETLLSRFATFDLIHCDIQGGELDLFTHSIDLVSKKVRRVVIGTHSWRIDHGLTGLFASHGWVLEGAEDCTSADDGSQVWRNPAL